MPHPVDLFGSATARIRYLIQELCKLMENEIIKGRISKDDDHLLVSVPPMHSISRFIGSIRKENCAKVSDLKKEILKSILEPTSEDLADILHSPPDM